MSALEVTECGGCERTEDISNIEALWAGWVRTSKHGIVCPMCAHAMGYFKEDAEGD